MKYYVAADLHGFFDPFWAALQEQGFFSDTAAHKLILCGDLFDRGPQAAKLQKFLLELLARDELILIRGNHEDLTLELLRNWHLGSYKKRYHIANGTVDTVCQLTGAARADLEKKTEEVGRAFLHTPYIQTLIPAMRDYYETSRYIFVHGWIPCGFIPYSPLVAEYLYMDGWRQAEKEQWEKARWINGMDAAYGGVTEPGKTIVCGHWHCSCGHACYEGRGGEFDQDPDFTPYYGKGIIALDACTVHSGRVNCILLED